ncbi:hypothetical protein SDC9_140650 [bioreactor metagenome]|uniref:Uncharacterized protein n=1 Tax=bioreactor metagenome TaxID=1076179 RepID=A0A645DYV1_9ZZZZ
MEMNEQSYYNQLKKEQLLRGLPVTHINESDSLTYYLRLNKFGEPFIKCYMYSELKDRNDLESVYTLVEFTQGVEFEDIVNNSFLIRELLCFGVQHLAFFDSDRDYIVNAIACSEYRILDELLHHKEYKITDVPVQYPVKIHDLKVVQELLNKSLESTRMVL